jgi:hypothetical protein
MPSIRRCTSSQKRCIRLQIRTNNGTSAAIHLTKTAKALLASDDEPCRSAKADSINQSQGVLVGRLSDCIKDDSEKNPEELEKSIGTTTNKPTHLIPEQSARAFRYVFLLSLKQQRIVHASRQFGPNPALWIYRKNAITSAGERRQRNCKTGAWVSFPNSHFRAGKMMREL